MTTVNDITDILRIIREQPEWADALRGALLGQDLLELPQRFDKFAETSEIRFSALESDVADLKAGQARLEGQVGNLEAGQARLEGRVGNLEAGQARLEGRVGNLEAGQARLEAGQARLEGQVGNLRGNSYEQKIGSTISSIMSERMNLLVRVLKRINLDDDSEFFDLLHDAEGQGIISRQERDAVANADIVLQERRRPDDAAIYIVAEVSTTLADNDIIRSADRASFMQRATGETTIPVVIGAYADDARQRLARERNVILITIPE